MYEYIRGNITELNPTNIIIEGNNIGYFVNISLNTYSKLNGKKEALILIHQIVREDAHILYGFADKNERDLFRNLISVNGVGASIAIMMLSSLNSDEIVAAVTSEKVDVLKGIKGIGTKTAQRIIIDLKDKFGKLPETGQFLYSPDNSIRIESLSALVMLGFAKKDAEKIVVKIVQEQPGATVESVIKQALKRL
ncbi:MAG: Holliday junction branch migration protein RuvA [Prolixibacteraceae bacterium]|jgi:holliday junction DNA helicase RuvA|nr:Holliday junction branch migration protein RuvA [Prolixibacteraceae bacterium]MBT6764249.1 Holliday junction branch migration protein RuvA [Prolixibacteraceae bacterium]MBT6997118.1 Holliday junction branch migration protein RuvA [Prolixibacteraceae bacterium]MBT7393349.1 Holliday junction branch migration protein RuvA [Prolixibacteraceae bacterium]